MFIFECYPYSNVKIHFFNDNSTVCNVTPIFILFRILVKLDDNIIRHYSHEATFIIEINLLKESGNYEIILIEIDATSS